MNTIARKMTFLLSLFFIVQGMMAAPTDDGRMVNKNQPKTMKQVADEAMRLLNGRQPITAQQLQSMRKAQKADENADWETLVSEDFSLWTKGTEDEPDSEMYPKDYFTTGNYMLPDSLFHTPSWSGLGAYEAGGCVALAYPDMGGQVSTPLMNMNGKLRVKARVKVIKKKSLFFLTFGAGGYVSPYNPIGDDNIHVYQFKPEDGWQDIEFEILNPSTADDCFLQVNAMAYNKGNVIVDQLSVERDRNYIATPQSLTASDFTYEGFTATWNKGYGADSYLVSLYKRQLMGTENFVSSNSFEDITADADGNLVGLADGWTGKVTGNEDGEVTLDDEGYDGTHSLIFTNDEDHLVFDPKGSDLVNLTLTAKKRVCDEKSSASLVIRLYDEYGHYLTLNKDLVDLGDDWFTFDLAESLSMAGFNIGNYSSKVEIYPSGFGAYEEMEREMVLLDAVCCETTPQVEVVCEKKDVAVDGNSVTFDDLDTNNTYMFTVQGVSDKGGKSDVSDTKIAYGVAAPHVKPATDINKRGAYTANWEAAPKATSYKLSSYEVYNVPEDMENYTLFEENFSKCTEGTEDELVFKGNYSEMLLDDYTDNAGWTGTGTLLCNGMVGCYTDDYGNQFDMLSPTMSLDNNGGEYTVTVDFKIQNEGETLIVQGDQTTYAAIECETAGKHTASVTLQGGTRASQLMFYTLNKSPFLLDKVAVTQDVKKDDKFYTKLEDMVVEDGETSIRVSGIEPRDGYTYAYDLVSYYDRYGTVYTSGRSDAQIVDFNNTGVKPAKLALEAQEGETTLYDMSGRQVSKAEKGIYIVKKGNKVQKVLVK